MIQNIEHVLANMPLLMFDLFGIVTMERIQKNAWYPCRTEKCRFICWVGKVNWPRQRTSKADVSRVSPSSAFELPCNGQFTLPTRLINPNFCIFLTHRTIVSSETNPFIQNRYWQEWLYIVLATHGTILNIVPDSSVLK